MISIVVPVYNEEDNIDPLCQRLLEVSSRFDQEWEVILVDDGSRDHSRERLRAWAEKNPAFKLILLRRNYGQATAMMAGFHFARGEVITPIDADLQNDPEDILKLVETLNQGYDVVSGWRRERKDHPLSRNLPSRVANMLVSWTSGVHLHDYGCTLKAYRREIVRDIRLYGEMHRFIPIFAHWQGGRVSEIPVRHHPRQFGNSKYGWNRVWKVALDLLVLRFMDRAFTRPIHVFGGFGLLSLLLSALLGLWAVTLKGLGQADFIETPLPLASLMTFLLGVLSILLGLIAEILVRTYFESQNRSVYSVQEAVNIETRNGLHAANGEP
ncbi:MAG: glycosyltransferase family 2 protein [Magnetococcales bacterium]|nr:glycosyltransferase family 2 protein [Magnetococcales bacterium]